MTIWNYITFWKLLLYKLKTAPLSLSLSGTFCGLMRQGVKAKELFRFLNFKIKLQKKKKKGFSWQITNDAATLVENNAQYTHQNNKHMHT